MTLPPVGTRERITIGCITVAFTLLLTLWALLTPLFGAPDEIAHFDAALQFALGHGWPDPAHLKLLDATRAMQAEGMGVLARDRPTLDALLAAYPGHDSTNQMTQHPPTWYVLAAGVLHLIGYAGQRWDIDLLALRLMNVAILCTLPLVIWAAVRALTRSPKTAIVAAAAVFLVPQVAFNGSAAGNDAPVIILGAVVTWLACRLLAGDRSLVAFTGLIVATSAAAAFKATALPVVPFAVAAVLVATPGAARWLRGAVALLVPVLLTSWWWVRNVLVFHTLQPAGLPHSIRHRDWPAGKGPDPAAFVNTEWSRVTNSFWGQFGLLQFPSSPIVIAVLSVVSIGIVIVWGFRRGPLRPAAWAVAVLPLASLAAGLQNNWSTYLRTTEMGGIQGRYYFVSIAALAVLSAIAWRHFVPDRISQPWTGLFLSIGSVLMALYGLSVAYRGYYEEAQFRLSADGLRLLSHLVPTGPVIFVSLAGVTLLALIAVALLAGRFVTSTATVARQLV